MAPKLKWLHNQRGNSVPLQLSKKGLWIKENLLSPQRRLFTKALKGKNGKLGWTNFIYISSAKKLHIWWGRRDSIHEGELWKE